MFLLIFTSLFYHVFSIYHLSSFHQWYERNNNQHDTGRWVQETSDGNFIVVGNTDSSFGIYPSTNSNVMILKFDSNGNLIWRKTLYTVNNEYVYSFVESDDLGFVLVGATYFSPNDRNIWVIKLNKEGDHEFTKILSDGYDKLSNFVLKTSEAHTFLIIGYTKTNDATDGYEGYVAKMNLKDPDDVFVWQRKYRQINSISIDDYLTGGIEAPDGNYIVVGYTFVSSHSEAWMMKISKIDGSILWSYTFFSSIPGELFTYIIKSKKMSGNRERDGYVLAGRTKCGECDHLVVKMDEKMDVEWVKKIRNQGKTCPDDLHDAVQTYDENYVFGGNICFSGGNQRYSVLFKMNRTGHVLWSKRQKGDPHQLVRVHKTVETRKGRLASVGCQNHPVYGQIKLFFSMLDANGSCCGWKNWNLINVEDWSLQRRNMTNNFTSSDPGFSIAAAVPGVMELNDGEVVLVCKKCEEKWFGVGCNVTECNGVYSNSSIVCGGHGNCEDFETCKCDVGYVYSTKYRMCVVFEGTEDDGNGDEGGEEAYLYGGIGAGTFLLFLGLGVICLCCLCLIFCVPFLILVLILVCCCCVTLPILLVVLVFILILLVGVIGGFICLFFASKSFGFGISANQKLFNEERRAELKSTEPTKLASLRINHDLFKVKLKEIKLIRILGEGGSNSTVYLAKFQGVEVAFKGFKTRVLCEEQDVFDEFEKEVSLLGSLAHPNILQFYGACLEPPRVGIIMEFCKNGDMMVFITEYRKRKEEIPYPIDEKVRMLHETALAMKYLHSRKIIHRDLKCENILITEDQHCKVMDFGCSKLVDRMSKQKTTRLGTPQYMAPEIVLGCGLYSTKVDVFSYSMVCFSILSENFLKPYGGNVQCVELKVANNPNFRPNLMHMRLKREGPVYKWIENMVAKCWNHEADDRYTFDEILDLFDQNL